MFTLMVKNIPFEEDGINYKTELTNLFNSK